MKINNAHADRDRPHPAIRWALTAPLDPLQIDCVTAIMPKILYDKCRMGQEEQIVFIAISLLSR